MENYLQKIVDNIQLSTGVPADLVLFHGSRGGLVRKPCATYEGLSDNGDFGKGFYLGTKRSQAESWIATNPDAILYTFSFIQNNLSCATLKNEAWLMFVTMNRGWFPDDISGYLKGGVFSDVLKSDLVIGEIADDKIATMLIEFKERQFTDKAFIACLRQAGLGMQYVLKTDFACRFLKQVKKERLSSQRKEKLVKSSRFEWSEKMRLLDDIIDANMNGGLRFKQITKILEEEINARQLHPHNLPQSGKRFRPLG